MKNLALIIALLAAPCAYAQTNIQGSSIQIGGSASGGSPLTTKGDLFGFSTVNARFPVGANGQVLTVDSSQPFGFKWGALPNSVLSINGASGAFTFSGPGQSCSGTTCTFSGGGSGGATFPGTNNIVFNTSTTASRNAVFGDVVALWTSCSAGFLKFDGTCSAGGTTLDVKTNSVDNTSQVLLNFTDTATVKASNPSGGIESFTVPTSTSSVLGASSPDNATIKATAGVYVAQNTTVNGTTCTPGSACTVTAAATVADYISAAQCQGGVSFSTGLGIYDNNAPQTGCYLPASSTAAYLAYQATPASPQYGEAVAGLPAFWTHTDLVFYFTSAVNSGNVTWEVQSACPAVSGSTPGTPSFGTALTVTVTVPGTIGQQATATIANIAQNSVNSCPAAGTTTPSQLIYRIFRGTDSAAGDAQLVGINLLTSRSQ